MKSKKVQSYSKALNISCDLKITNLQSICESAQRERPNPPTKSPNSHLNSPKPPTKSPNSHVNSPRIFVPLGKPHQQKLNQHNVNQPKVKILANQPNTHESQFQSNFLDEQSISLISDIDKSFSQVSEVLSSNYFLSEFESEINNSDEFKKALDNLKGS